MGKINSKFPNLVILEYYSIENYLFHPDNLIEIFPEFDKVNYVAEITKEKNRLKNDIKSKMRNDRNSYIFFQKNYLNQTSTSFDNLFKTLDSDEFENFYKIFKMKGKANLCNIPNIGKFENSLVKTKWFKEQVSSLFEKSGIEIN